MKSDARIVATKGANKEPRGAAEFSERRGATKGNSKGQSTRWIQSQGRVEQATKRVRLAAKRKEGHLTSLLQHVSVDSLFIAYLGLKRLASAGVDGITWRKYGENLTENLTRLHRRIHSGAYRGLPVRRVEIPKPDGGTRPLGIPALEDKIVQKALVDRALTPIYEEHFLGMSYGFRPGRGAHDALDALAYGIERKKINYILDADIRSYFDNVNRDHLVRFIEHLIGDIRVIRLIRKWLKGGVMDKGVFCDTGKGTPQGAVVSPTLSNIYLHYVLDLWATKWRKSTEGDMIIVRYADDFVVGFQHKGQAQGFLRELKDRFEEFSLELHSGKTRLIEFGRFAASNRKSRGQGRPETFDFLGFTHFCTRTGEGHFRLGRKPIAKRLNRTLRKLGESLKIRVYKDDLWKCGTWLGQVAEGWLNYYAVPGSMRYLLRFTLRLKRLWLKALRRRSQRARSFAWAKLGRIAEILWPPISIRHPWPDARCARRYNLK